MPRRPLTFAKALEQIRKRDAGAATPSLDELEGRFFPLLEREVDKLRPASMRVAKIGRKISAQRLASLKQALALLDEIVAEADAPGGQVDTVKSVVNIAKAIALVAAVVEDPSMAPVITNLRKRASDTLDQ